MNEILSLHIGQAGVGMGRSIWDKFSLEDPSESAFYSISDSGSLTPRAMFIDMDPSSIDPIRRCNTFKSASLLSGKESSGSNYVVAYQTAGRELAVRSMERVRKELEACDKPQGFMLTHSICGGSGSGLTARILNDLYDEYRKKEIVTFTNIPSPRIANATVEPYNAGLCLYEMNEYANMIVVFDNEAGYNICSELQKIEYPSYHNINQNIASSISAITASMRHEGTLNINLREITTNLVPFPNSVFLFNSYAPFYPLEKTKRYSLDTITHSVFEKETCLASCDMSKGKYIASCLLYRGNVIPRQVASAVKGLKYKKTIEFIDFSPAGFKCGFADSSSDISLSNLSSNTAISLPLRRICKNFSTMYDKKWFYWSFIGEGLQDGTFCEVIETFKHLCHVYEQDLTSFA